MFGKKKQPDLLSRYEDPTGGFSSRDLRVATWYVRHKDQVRALCIITFSLFDAVLIGYGLWGWGMYATVGYTQDRNMYVQQTYEFPNYEALHAQYGARPLQFASVDVYASGNERYDFAVDVQNSNIGWVAFVTYQFLYAGGETEVRTVPIMPGVRQPLVSIGTKTNGLPSTVRFSPVSIAWKHVNRHDVSDVQDFLAKRNSVTVSDVTFVSAGETGAGGHQITFDLQNSTVFSFWSGQYVVEFRDLDRRTGVAQLILDQFEAGSVERVDLRSFAPTLSVSDVIAHPQINFFDQTEYMN
jgi:hypothetical protein